MMTGLFSDSLQQRELERVQLQENLKKADETLSDLVDGMLYACYPNVVCLYAIYML